MRVHACQFSSGHEEEVVVWLGQVHVRQHGSCSSAPVHLNRRMGHRSSQESLDLHDVLYHGFKDAACAPLELAAAAFAGLGSLLARLMAVSLRQLTCTISSLHAYTLVAPHIAPHIYACSYHMQHSPTLLPILLPNLQYVRLANRAQLGDDFHIDPSPTPVDFRNVEYAMRRPGLLPRAHQMFPHAAGHVLATMAVFVQRLPNGYRSVGGRRLHLAWAGYLRFRADPVPRRVFEHAMSAGCCLRCKRSTYC
jgi:hypothetical protein